VTVDRQFLTAVERYLDDRAGDLTVAYLEDALSRTAQVPQRPWWSSPERWLPVDLTLRRVPFAPVNLRAIALLLLAALLVAAGVVYVVGSQHRLPSPFGIARNGATVVGMDGDLFRFEPGAGRLTPLIAGPSWDVLGAFSRDGTRIAFWRFASDPTVGPEQPMTITIADADGTNIRELTAPVSGNDWADWSPDGTAIVYMSRDDAGHAVLHVLDVASTRSSTIDVGLSVRSSLIAWRPPDGRELVFRADSTTEHQVLAVRPDGTGLRVVSEDCDCDVAGVSPDGATLTITRWDDDGPRIFLLDLTTGTERLLPIPLLRMSRGGVFSPDGKLLAFPLLRHVAENQTAYQVAVVALGGSGDPRLLGPEVTLPPNSDEAFVTLGFTPDGSAVLAAYPDDPSSPTNTIRSLPIDGSPGLVIGRGTFATTDVQRLALP
jgi:Tol biopolymer transport system component